MQDAHPSSFPSPSPAALDRLDPPSAHLYSANAHTRAVLGASCWLPAVRDSNHEEGIDMHTSPDCRRIEAVGCGGSRQPLIATKITCDARKHTSPANIPVGSAIQANPPPPPIVTRWVFSPPGMYLFLSVDNIRFHPSSSLRGSFDALLVEPRRVRARLQNPLRKGFQPLLGCPVQRCVAGVVSGVWLACHAAAGGAIKDTNQRFNGTSLPCMEYIP